MQSLTRQIFQAILGNGYELQVDRERRGGTGVLLRNARHDEEAFYFFTESNEAQVVETMAWQYCSDSQLANLYPDSTHRKYSLYSNRVQYA